MSENLLKARVKPEPPIVLVTVERMRSVPKKAISASVTAPEPQACADGYSGWLGELGDAGRALNLLLRARDRRSGRLVCAHVDPRLDSLSTIRPNEPPDPWRRTVSSRSL